MKQTTLTLPNLILIPLFSAIFSVIKICNGVSWDWGMTLVFAPMFAYFVWTMIQIIPSILLIRLSNDQKIIDFYKKYAKSNSLKNENDEYKH